MNARTNLIFQIEIIPSEQNVTKMYNDENVTSLVLCEKRWIAMRSKTT